MTPYELKAQHLAEVLKPGEKYAGLILGKNGEPDYHLILLAGEPTDDLNWKAAQDWAKRIGGELPTCREQALLFANLKEEFEDDWYWSNEKLASAASYAWYQRFLSGIQGSTYASRQLRARAVRRVPSDPEPAMNEPTEIRLDADATQALRHLLRAAERVETDLLARGLHVAAELLIDADGATVVIHAEGDPVTARAACERSGYLVDAIDWHTDDSREIATYRVRVERIDVGLIVTRRQQRGDAHGVQPCTPAPQPAAAVPA